MKKILMYGPAYGHNAEPFVAFFNDHQTFKLTYFYRGKNNFETDYPNVTYVKIEAKFNSLIKLANVIHDDYDLIWIHGGYSLSMLIFVLIFKNKKSKLNLNIWGEAIPNKIINNTLYGKIYRYVLRYFDFIQCNWYGTYNILKNNLNHNLTNKLVVLPWGLSEEFFIKYTHNEPSRETKSLINKIGQKKAFFYPKTLSEASGHDIIIEAVRKLVEKKNKDFLIIFWQGNTDNPLLFQKYRKMIDDYFLSDYILLMPRHKFVPFKEMQYIWKHMDVGLQIAYYDQFSTTFLEPMILKKPFIATRIEPYQIYEKKFNLDLQLVQANTNDVFLSLKKYIDGYKVPAEDLEKRKKIVEENFNFNRNIEKILRFFLDKD